MFTLVQTNPSTFELEQMESFVIPSASQPEKLIGRQTLDFKYNANNKASPPACVSIVLRSYIPS